MSMFLIGDMKDGPVEAVTAKAPVLFRRAFHTFDQGENKFSKEVHVLVHSRIVLLATLIVQNHPQPKSV